MKIEKAEGIEQNYLPVYNKFGITCVILGGNLIFVDFDIIFGILNLYQITLYTFKYKQHF